MLPSRNTLILGLTSAIPTFFSASWMFFLPIIFRQIGYSIVTIGIFYGTSTVLSSTLSVFAGRLVLKIGPKRGIMIGGVIRSISILMIYTFSPILVPSGFIIDLGIGYPLSNVSRQYLIIKDEENKQATNVGWFMTIAGLPAIFSPILGALTEINKILILLTAVTTLIATVVRALILTERKVNETFSINFSTISSPSVDNNFIHL
ncbi:MFS transporter [Sulfurisphaera tokodaii]|uniref:MFS transporter n=2 Tax=Sulfurisphaera tokodaii TaxID=111955 RepID=Q972Q2_SULTO|nr:MFS transporter [Sulfurisphaera tokodaii]BAB66112.1 hypothetical protein STK_10810 [Sulfurisphaera tokodaii str. 7]HII75406.1 MFS transporter [Sulfurisphaera tokodaii]